MLYESQAGTTVCVGGPNPEKPGFWTFANLGDSQAVLVDTKEDVCQELTHMKNIQDPVQQYLLFNAHPNEKPKVLSDKSKFVMGRVAPTSVIGDFHLKEP